MRKNTFIAKSISKSLVGIAFTFAILFCSSPIYALNSGTLIALTNAQRTALGLTPLAYNGMLATAANAKATDMCNDNYWDHTAPDGTTGWTFMKLAGYSYTTAGENLAKGFDNDQAVIDSWMASPTHRSNIVKSTYKDIGIGSFQCGATVYDTIIVAMYGAQAVAAPSPAPVPTPKPVPSSTPAPTVQKTASTAPIPEPTPVTPTEQAAPVSQSITVSAVVLPTPENSVPIAPVATTTQKDHKDMSFIELVVHKIKELFASEVKDMLTLMKSA